MSEISVDLANENVSVIAELNKLRDEIRELNEQVESEQYNARRWREQYEKLAPSHDRLILKNEQLQKERDGLLATIHSRVNGEKADIDFANKELVKYQQACTRLLAERTQAEALTRVAWEEGETLRAQLDYAKAWRDRYQTLYTEFRDNVKRAARNRQLKAERRKEKQRKRKLKRKYNNDLPTKTAPVYISNVAAAHRDSNINVVYWAWRYSYGWKAVAIRGFLDEWKEAQRVKTNPHRS